VNRFEFWTIAYRKRGEKLLPENTEAPFQIIKNTWRYWCADPHLYERDGHTYVFAELYDRVLRQGVIGCCEISDGGCTPWRVVLKQPWHLSYPHIFQTDDEIYMIPESYVGKEIALFRASAFPNQWEKVKTLKSGCVAVDSTVFETESGKWLLTLEEHGGREDLVLYRFENGSLAEHGFTAAEGDLNTRPAGHFFDYKDMMLRPAQDCTESYGCALNFYRVDAVEETAYRERLLQKIRPGQIRSDCPYPPEGIHTYNFSEHYEVIDLKGYERDWLFPIMRVVWFVHRKLKGLLKR